MTAIGIDIAHAAALLRGGDLVAIPTETVYGLAGNALSDQAVRKIFAAKQRPLHNPLILHLGSAEQLSDFAEGIPDLAWELARHFWPGPLTLLLPKRAGKVPDVVNNGLPELALRVPNHPMSLELLRRLDFPLAAPSANPFGYISPTTPQHVLEQLGGKIPYILDGGPCPTGIESTIVRFEQGIPVVLRHGAIPAEAIEAIAGRVDLQIKRVSSPVAPGMLPSHYAPRTLLVLVDDPAEYLRQHPASNPGALLFTAALSGIPTPHQRILSPSQDLEEAARNLYAALHQLDHLGLSVIIAERLPEQGIGAAINDRLSRAAAEKS